MEKKTPVRCPKAALVPAHTRPEAAESYILLFLAAFLLPRSAKTRSVTPDVQLVAMLLPCTCLHSHIEFQAIQALNPRTLTQPVHFCTFDRHEQTAPDCFASILIAHQLPFSPLCLQCAASSVGSGKVRPTPEVADRRHTPGRRGCDNNFVPQNGWSKQPLLQRKVFRARQRPEPRTLLRQLPYLAQAGTTRERCAPLANRHVPCDRLALGITCWADETVQALPSHPVENTGPHGE